MAEPGVRRRKFAAFVRTQTGLTAVDCNDGCEFAVGDSKHAIGSAKLDAVAAGERARLLPENLDALEPCRRVFHDRAVLDFDFEEVAS